MVWPRPAVREATSSASLAWQCRVSFTVHDPGCVHLVGRWGDAAPLSTRARCRGGIRVHVEFNRPRRVNSREACLAQGCAHREQEGRVEERDATSIAATTPLHRRPFTSCMSGGGSRSEPKLGGGGLLECLVRTVSRETSPPAFGGPTESAPRQSSASCLARINHPCRGPRRSKVRRSDERRSSPKLTEAENIARRVHAGPTRHGSVGAGDVGRHGTIPGTREGAPARGLRMVRGY